MRISFGKRIGLLRRAAACGLAALVLLSLGGCLYPDDHTPGGSASAREAVNAVQDAVDRYQASTGLLPIVTADETVPIYEKYKVDLAKLQRMDYLGSIPRVAFENGGKDQFLLIDEETDPTVKLLDLTVYQSASDVQKKVDEYVSKRGGEVPLGEQLYPGFYVLDFAKLGTGEPDIRSMFSGQSLAFLTDEQGTVYLDYGADIATAAAKSETDPGTYDDLRRLLAEASYYVPVKSPVYKWVEGAPQATREQV
ncbi:MULTISPECIES: hypothetical protein [Cohnella]|uniref:hypothetical protein n=1 Tax=Cohnella TaxID=329857 RepID=UPI0009BBE845|nr:MULTISPECIES: hypothetical protein [Cohnella]MBN2984322.1 hypothetical protein [Cohnella algarum]